MLVQTPLGADMDSAATPSSVRFYRNFRYLIDKSIGLQATTINHLASFVAPSESVHIAVPNETCMKKTIQPSRPHTENNNTDCDGTRWEKSALHIVQDKKSTQRRDLRIFPLMHAHPTQSGWGGGKRREMFLRVFVQAVPILPFCMRRRPRPRLAASVGATERRNLEAAVAIRPGEQPPV